MVLKNKCGIDVFIDFVEGKLTPLQCQEVESMIVQDPDLIALIGGLNRIKNEIGPSMSIKEYLADKKRKVQAKMLLKQSC